MDTVVVKGGKFTFTLSGEELSRGLRPSARSPRNKEYLVECVGAVGRDGALSVLDALDRIDTTGLVGSFPYPQIFICTSTIILCDAYNIYEFDGTTMTLKYTVADIAWPWTLVDFFEYIYLSNGYVALVRDPFTRDYSVSTTLPAAITLCNFNGQVLAGSPDVVDIITGLLSVICAPISIITSIIGTCTTEIIGGDYIIDLKFNGVDGAITWTEDAQGLDPTTSQGCEIDTAQHFAGSSSLLLNHPAIGIDSARVDYTLPDLCTDEFTYTSYTYWDTDFTGDDWVIFLNVSDNVNYWCTLLVEYVTPTDNLHVVCYDDIGTVVIDYTTPFVLTPNTWHKFEATKVGDDIVVTIDDTIVASGATVNSFMFDTVTIGARTVTSESLIWFDSVTIA